MCDKPRHDPRVIVCAYQARWPFEFEMIRSQLADALGKDALTIEHVGSTAVPGLCAKPIIDIDVVIQDERTLASVIGKLAAIGYQCEGDLGIPQRYAFRYQGKTDLMRHHLYVCPQSSPELRRHLRFRDTLRDHPDAAERYGRVKREGAARFPDDIDGYIAYKSHVINEILRECGL